MHNRVQFRSINYFLLIIILIISSSLSVYFPFLSSIDELSSLLFLFIIIKIVIFHWKELDSIGRYAVSFLFFYILIGVLSSVLISNDRGWNLIFLDMIMSSKPVIGLICGYFISTKRLISDIRIMCKPIVIPLIVLISLVGITSQFKNFGFTDGARYGIKVYNFTFNFSGELGYFIIVLTLLSIIGRLNLKLKIMDCIIFIMSSISIILTTKLQAYLFIIILIPVYFLLRNKNKLNIIHITLVGFFSYFLGKHQLETYFLDTVHYSPRRLFLQTSINLANQLFPLGSGFSTFGSELAARYYSPVYIRLGFYKYYGMDSYQYKYLNDTFIAMIIGQSGWLGFLSYYGIFFLFYLIINKMENTLNKSFAIAGLITIVIGSVGSGTVKSATGLFYCFVLGLLIGSEKIGVEKK